jgi:MFS family permease
MSAHHHHPHRWRLLVVLCLAQFMLIADVTVINVALPTVGDELSLSAGAMTWVVTAYTLFFGSLLLLGGRLADAVGRLRVFLAGLAVFTAASVAAGLATSGGMLIAARSAQGVGAALLSPAAMALVVSLFHGPDRNRALGAWAAVGGAGSAVACCSVACSWRDRAGSGSSSSTSRWASPSCSPCPSCWVTPAHTPARTPRPRAWICRVRSR